MMARVLIWIDIPETIFLLERNQIKRVISLLKEMCLEKGFLLGITEDIPVDCLEMWVEAILSVMGKYGEFRLSVVENGLTMRIFGNNGSRSNYCRSPIERMPNS